MKRVSTIASRWNLPCGSPDAVWSNLTSVSPADRPKEWDRQTAPVPAAVAATVGTKEPPNRGLPAAAHRNTSHGLERVFKFKPPFPLTVERGNAGSADKTAPPPRLPLRHRPPLPLHFAPRELHPASRLVHVRPLPECLTLLMSSKCLFWTHCPQFPFLHLRIMNKNGNRSEERIQF